ncbi:MAG: sulfotransferase family 2 domain-containing protein [Methylococcales bacterium]
MESPKPARTVILHAHIFKNAGTSVDNILQFNYDTQFIDHLETDKLAEEKQLFLDNYLRQHPNIIAFASHHLPLPLQAVPDLNYCVIMMLRHPIIRASSAYRFERTQQTENPSADAAKRYDFADYVRWNVDNGYQTFFNYFVRYCTSTVSEQLSAEMRLKYAINQSENFAVLGVVERFAESMTVLKKNLRTNGLDLKLIQSRKNVTDQSSDRCENKLARIQQQLGEPLYATLLELNKEDLAFYQHSVQQLDADKNKLLMIQT